MIPPDYTALERVTPQVERFDYAGLAHRLEADAEFVSVALSLPHALTLQGSVKEAVAALHSVASQIGREAQLRRDAEAHVQLLRASLAAAPYASDVEGERVLREAAESSLASLQDEIERLKFERDLLVRSRDGVLRAFRAAAPTPAGLFAQAVGLTPETGAT